MKPSRTHVRRFLAVLTLFTLAFIFGNSILSAEVSVKISTGLMTSLGGEAEGKNVSNPPAVPASESGNGVFYLRKLGHFSEFLVLGGEISLLLLLYGIPGREGLLLLCSGGLLVPLLDETIQIFSKRNPRVQDLWIDIAGYMTGALLAFLVWLVGVGFGKRKERSR